MEYLKVPNEEWCGSSRAGWRLLATYRFLNGFGSIEETDALVEQHKKRPYEQLIYVRGAPGCESHLAVFEKVT